MPQFTAEKPHAITCIKNSIRDVLQRECGDDLTVSCDRADCWADDELFKWRQALNIVTRNDFIGNPVKAPREGRKLGERQPEDAQCFHQATLNVDIVIYVEDCEDCADKEDDCSCMDGKTKAYSIMGHITRALSTNQDDISGRRIIYKGSTFERESQNELDVVAVIASFEIYYLFDQTRPWVVG